MTMIQDPADERSEIAFFDLETTVPTRPGQGFAILEFGAIIICSRKLVELRDFSTLVRPASPSLISSKSVRCNGITYDAVVSAPTFAEIANTVYDILNGRIWAGHNIQRFDCVRIREAFAEIGRLPPENKGIIDTLPLLTRKFGRRAGDMKMASLATYFGLGKQKHRSLDDVRMNLEVLRYCATVLFLESSVPDAFPDKSWLSPNATTRSRKIGQSSLEGPGANIDAPSSSENISVAEGSHPMVAFLENVGSFTTNSEAFDLSALSNDMNTECVGQDVAVEEVPLTNSSEIPSSVAVREGGSGAAEFVEPHQVSIPSIRASFNRVYGRSKRMVLLHERDGLQASLQLRCLGLKVRFGLSTKYSDNAGRPRLNFVVDAPSRLCDILDRCDEIARELFGESDGSSEWRHVVSRKPGYFNKPIVRLHLPAVVNGDVAQYATEINQKDGAGKKQRLILSRYDAEELGSWLNSRSIVDACFSLEPYDYHQNAGIRLVAKQVTIHQK